MEAKIIAIGDIHGHDEWQAIVEKEKDADKIIFIGDYFDSFDVPAAKQFENFNNILQFKIDHPDQVVLLIGNHDFHYLTVAAGDRYSGFQPDRYHDIRDVLEVAIEEGLMQMAFQSGKFLFTHAGVTKTWFETIWGNLGNYAERINNAFVHEPEKFKFTPSNPLDNCGESITQPPIWVRPEALARDMVDPDLIQVVGHTRMKHVMLNLGLILIDTMDHSQEYLAIVDGKPEVREI